MLPADTDWGAQAAERSPQLVAAMLRLLLLALACLSANALMLGAPARVAARGSTATMAAAKIRTGDMVKVLAGDDKGTVGKVRHYLQPSSRCSRDDAPGAHSPVLRLRSS
jgi:hypothetical protein